MTSISSEAEEAPEIATTNAGTPDAPDLDSHDPQHLTIRPKRVDDETDIIDDDRDNGELLNDDGFPIKEKHIEAWMAVTGQSRSEAIEGLKRPGAVAVGTFGDPTETPEKKRYFEKLFEELRNLPPVPLPGHEEGAEEPLTGPPHQDPVQGLDNQPVLIGYIYEKRWEEWSLNGKHYWYNRATNETKHSWNIAEARDAEDGILW